MNRRSIFSMSAIVALGLVVLPTGAVSQQRTLKEQLVGAWTLVSIVATDKAGAKSDRRGPNPKGLLIFEANGRYSLLTSRSDIPNFNVGTWSIEGTTNTITANIEAGSFPNLNGNTQKRVISSLTADELRYTNGALAAGTVDEAVWRRVK